MRSGAYQQPASQLPGVQTFVQNPDGSQPDSGYSQQALPDPWTRSKPTGMPQYNKPGLPEDAPDGKSLSRDRARTLSKPGEDSPHPDPPARSTPVRRPDVTGDMIERVPMDREPGQWFDRADLNGVPPGDVQVDRVVPQLEPGFPGSAKVIPDGYGFVNKDERHIVAVHLGEILDRCGPSVAQRAQGLAVKLRRVDAKNHLWLFDVPGSKMGDMYRIRVKALARPGVKDVRKADLLVSCSCPFWQWQGPEHHALIGRYLYGKPKGTASLPVIKDPTGKHGACKHVVAVLNHMQDQSWFLPGTGKKASTGTPMVWGLFPSQDQLVERVARRYGEQNGWRV